MKAVIVGGGIGGLAAAVALRDVGMEATVVERAERDQATGAGISIGPNAIAGFRRLGVADEILRRSGSAATRVVRDKHGRRLVEGPFGGGAARRSDIQEALLGRLGGAVRFGERCTGLAGDGDGVEATLADGSTVAADLLIGADGLRSQIRAQLFPDHLPIYRGATTWRGISRLRNDIVDNRINETWGCGQRIGLLGLDDGWIYWFTGRNAPEGEEEPKDERKAKLLALFRGWHDPIEEALENTEGSIIRTDLYDLDPLPRWSEGRVTLLGDAAHAMTPDMGQGAAQAIEDALALASALEREPDVPSALRAYEAERRKPAYAMMRKARRHLRLSHLDNRFACAVRNRAVRTLPERAQVALGVRRATVR